VPGCRMAFGRLPDPVAFTITNLVGNRIASKTTLNESIEVQMLAEDGNFSGLARLNRELVGKAEALDSGYRTALDMDSTEILVYGEQEESAYNGHFESTYFHPLILFN